MNYSLILGVPEHEFRIYTRLSDEGWFAHLERASGFNPTKRTAVVHQSGATPEQALWKLHIASAKATGGHLQEQRPNSSVGTAGIEQPGALSDDEDDDEEIYHGNESVCSESEDEELDDRSGTDLRTQTEPVTRIAMAPVSAFPAKGGFHAAEINQRPRSAQPSPVVTRKGPSLSGLPPPDNPRPNLRTREAPPRWQASNAPPSVPVRIRIDFVNYGTFEITERVPMTQNEVLTAATRHCDMLMGIKCLRASLKSVAAGGTKLLVQGCVSDLVAMVRALPAKGGAPIFEVEVTKGPGV